MAQFAFQSASELTQQLRDGKVSSLELVDYFIARIEKYDTEINAVVVRDFERARLAARRALLRARRCALSEAAGARLVRAWSRSRPANKIRHALTNECAGGRSPSECSARRVHEPAQTNGLIG